MNVFEKAIRTVVGDKRRWHAYRDRVKALPSPQRAAAMGLERYLMYTGPGDGEKLLDMLDDLVELFEQSVADGTSVRNVVGEDPVEFAETFKANYGHGAWLGREQQRLVDAVSEAESGSGSEGGPR